MTKKMILFIVLTIAQTMIRAQDKIDTDRPDQTESVFTVPRHWLQLETGFSMQQDNKQEKEYLIPSVLTKYGISKRIEFRLITTYQSNVSDLTTGRSITKGLAPTEAGAKICLWEEKKFLPKTSFIFHVGIPFFAAKKFRPDNVPVNFRFTMQHSLSEKISLGYNAGAEWDGETSHPVWVYTLTTGYDISESWYGYLEAFGSVAKYGPPQHNIDGGIAYTIGNNMKVDLSSGFGISAAAPQWYIAVGYSVRFKATH